jgi:hypothetical protein
VMAYKRFSDADPPPIGDGIAVTAVLCVAIGGAQALDESRYPDWRGQWRRVEPGDPVRFDPSKPPGLGQQAPLTPEYQAIFEAGLADMAAGGAGLDRSYICIPPGMPRIMNVYTPMEIVVTPETTYILIDHIYDHRRIFTDGRGWPDDVEPSYAGYSIGKWIDEGGDGHYDVLEVETRHLKGPRVLETTGLPLHRDNKTIVHAHRMGRGTKRQSQHRRTRVAGCWALAGSERYGDLTAAD